MSDAPQTAPDNSVRIPPAAQPPETLGQAVAWLEGEAHRIIRASVRRMTDGTAAFPPQVGINYEAFWLRDYAYALEGSIRSFSDRELTEACRLFVRSLREDGAAVDCVAFDGTPIYKPGYGSMGREPVADGPPFTVSVAWQTWKRTNDRELLNAVLDPLVKTMTWLPRNPDNGLVHIAEPGERCPYGFTDTIPKVGDVLFCSLLAVQASRQLGELLDAAGRADEAARWRGEGARITAGIRSTMWIEDTGLFRAATVKCNVPDIWGSAFAVWLSVATDEQSQRIAGYFREHYDELVMHGQIRHIPGFTDWDGNRVAENGGDYQSGAFWATPVGWFVFALDRLDPALADRTVIGMVKHFQQHGANEWINAKECRLAGYLASAALPLAGIRDMMARRS